MIIALVLGIVFGFISAVPVAGPISAIIFSRGMEGKYAQGRSISWGSGIAEAAYTFLAFWSFGRFLANLTFVVTLSNGVAAFILAILGVYFYRSKKMRKPASTHHASKWGETKAFLLGAGMSAINPSLIASWTIVAATVHSMKLFEFSILHSLSFSVGVCFGIVAWFITLLALMKEHRDRLNANFLDRGLKAIGIFLFGLSLWMVYQVLQSF